MISKKAFTLIELLLALALFSVVMAVVVPFFLSNYRSINETTIKSELQFQAESAMRDIAKLAMESSGIKEIKDINELSKLGYNQEVYTKELDFIGENNSVIQLRLENDNLIRVNGTSSKDIAKDVSSIRVSPLGAGAMTFQDASAIKIIIVFQKNNVEYTISNNLYFRNKR